MTRYPYPSPEVVEAATDAVHRVLRVTSRRYPPRDYARRLASAALTQAYFSADPTTTGDLRRWCGHCQAWRAKSDIKYRDIAMRCPECDSATMKRPPDL